MEEGPKNHCLECFEPSASQNCVSIDIWERILRLADPQSLGQMAQTSKSFEKFVRKIIRVNNYQLARQYRKEGQIHLACECLKSCVDHNHPEATFQLAYSYYAGGWGIGPDQAKDDETYALAKNLGCTGYHLVFKDYEYELTKEFLQSPKKQEDEYYQYHFGIMLYNGYYYLDKNEEKGLEWLTKSAEQGFARAQRAVGRLTNDERWLKKAEKQKNKW
jgi:TPR repeat protein